MKAFVKSLFFYSILLLLTLACIEGGARAAYFILYGKGYRSSSLAVDSGMEYMAPEDAGEPQEPLESEDPSGSKTEEPKGWEPKFARAEPLHPYLGYAVTRKRLGSHGFDSRFSPLSPAKENELTVLLTGGSVAGQLSVEGFEQLFNHFLEGRSSTRVRVFPVVGGGYKQPQQLQALTYFLSIGAHFDIIVNLDGFNDGVLPYADNATENIYPFYPRAWAMRLAVRGGKIDRVALGELSFLRTLRTSLVDWAQDSALGTSAMVGIAVRRMIDWAGGRIAEIEQSLAEQRRNSGYDFELNGPVFPEASRDEVIAASVETWARASVLMYEIATDVGAEYYHFLQPNQYLAGSKPFSSEERQHFLVPESRYGKVAIPAYPLLVAKGEALPEQGVPYFDLTGLFGDTTETVYRDSCCHFNRKGVEAMALRIIETVWHHSAKFDRLGSGGAEHL